VVAEAPGQRAGFHAARQVLAVPTDGVVGAQLGAARARTLLSECD